MNSKTNTSAGNVIRILSAIAVAAMLAVSVLVYKAPVPAVMVFIAYILIYVQLPGLLIVKLAGIRPAHASAEIVIGLFSGWALTMLLYFVTDVIGTNVLLYAAGPALSLIYLIIRIIKKDFVLRRISWNSVSPAWCVFFALSLLFILLKTQYVYMSPEYCDFIYMNADKAYHMGLINSLAYDYPLQSPWIQGRYINYHIFTEILYAVPVRLFGISSDVVLSSCGPLMTAYTLCLTFYAFFRTMCRRADRAGIYCLVMLLSNIFIVRNITSSIAFLFAYKNENTAGYGIAGAMAVILMLKEWYDGPGREAAASVVQDSAGMPKHAAAAEARTGGLKSLPSLLVLLALVMCETGIKGPMGATLIAGMWGTFILGLIMRKVKFSKVVPLLILSAGFLAVYVTVLGSKGQSNSSGNALFALATISDICFWKEPLTDMMKAAGVPYVAMLAVILLVFMIFMLTAFFLPFVIGYLRELVLVLTGRKEFDFTRIVIYAASLVGLVAMFILNYSGHSQIYFGLVMVFFAPLISYWLFEDLEEKHAEGRSRGILSGGLKGLTCVLLIATTVSLGMNYYANIGEAVKHADPGRSYNKYKSISNDEYAAMIWLRDNTPEDSLLATDRYYSVPLEEYSYENRWSNRFFLYAVYSQRFCYIAGSGYNLGAKEWPIRQEMLETNSKLYDPENEDRGELANELGVDYVVVSKRFTELPSLESDDYELCFTNGDVDIYEVITEDDAA